MSHRGRDGDVLRSHQLRLQCIASCNRVGSAVDAASFLHCDGSDYKSFQAGEACEKVKKDSCHDAVADDDGDAGAVADDCCTISADMAHRGAASCLHHHHRAPASQFLDHTDGA